MRWFLNVPYISGHVVQIRGQVWTSGGTGSRAASGPTLHARKSPVPAPGWVGVSVAYRSAGGS